MKFPRLLLFLCLAAALPARAQDTGGGPEQQARAFYAWYLHELNAGGEPITKKKAEMAKYISARFLKQIARQSRREGRLDADPFLWAQDWDRNWEKNIAVRYAHVEGNRAYGLVAMEGKMMGNGNGLGMTRYGLVMPNGQGMGSHSIEVNWVREAGAWKIDRTLSK